MSGISSLSEEKGTIKGVCALHVLWEDLAEVRSLAVRKEYQKLGIGKQMVKRCLSEAKALGIKRVFVLTYQPLFFKKLGFTGYGQGEPAPKNMGRLRQMPEIP